ncbi:MAG: DegV family protein [Chloroflexi bacterium]|jgi:DegV family protein with EDD domain|nr:DegV family protein [Chloroflexota bacterium]
MKIVTDSGTDSRCINTNNYEIHEVSLKVNIGEKVYLDGQGQDLDQFYQSMETSEILPKTSQPSAGEFADLYRKLSKEDKEILSIHISSGLSGTVNSAKAAVAMVPEANVTIVDTKTLSVGAGWQVIEAAKAAAAGWSKEQIVPYLKRIADATRTIYTLKELKYLINGGRISHMKGLIASILNIKPLIGVDNEKGNYTQLGQSRSFKLALQGLVNLVGKTISPSEKMVAQIVHADNTEGAESLKEQLDSVFKTVWYPISQLSLVLGAHTGSSLVGVCYAPAAVFEGL